MPFIAYKAGRNIYNGKRYNSLIIGGGLFSAVDVFRLIIMKNISSRVDVKHLAGGQFSAVIRKA